MRDLMAAMKALADENRVRIIAALGRRELCVCQIVELLELAPSTVSKHMAILKQARLVDNRKQGRWIYYRLADRDVLPVGSEATSLVLRFLEGDPRARQDTGRLKQILKVDPDALCKRQHRC